MVGLTKKPEVELPAEKPGVTTSTGLQVLPPLSTPSPPFIACLPSSHLHSISKLPLCSYCLPADHVVMPCTSLLLFGWPGAGQIESQRQMLSSHARWQHACASVTSYVWVPKMVAVVGLHYCITINSCCHGSALIGKSS